jgi:hypothetical protein
LPPYLRHRSQITDQRPKEREREKKISEEKKRRRKRAAESGPDPARSQGET